MDILDNRPPPKRGDIVHTNVGDRRERTCLTLRVRKSRLSPRRWNVWCERWWEIEPVLRMRLYRSAERAGGQNVMYFRRYPAKPKKRPVDLFHP